MVSPSVPFWSLVVYVAASAGPITADAAGVEATSVKSLRRCMIPSHAVRPYLHQKHPATIAPVIWLKLK